MKRESVSTAYENPLSFFVLVFFALCYVDNSNMTSDI